MGLLHPRLGTMGSELTGRAPSPAPSTKADQSAEDTVECEPLPDLDRLGRQLGSAFRRMDQLNDSVRQRPNVIHRHKSSIDPIPHDLRRPEGAIGGDHRPTQGHGLDEHIGEAFHPGRQHEHAGAADGRLRVVGLTGQAHVCLQPFLRHQGLQGSLA